MGRREQALRRRAEALRPDLERLYKQYHQACWIGSDPIQFIYRFDGDADREIVGLLAASLAYGNVATINASIGRVLERLEGRPHDYLLAKSEGEIFRAMAGFRHRWTDQTAMAGFLNGVRRVVREHGSLGAAFRKGDPGGPDYSDALSRWVERLQPTTVGRGLLARPERQSACKRLHLYLRWMVRKDVIDPGCWAGMDPARLCMPLDVHMHRFARGCGFTRRRAADGRTVNEVTEAFRMVCPKDPVRYDFCLTRPGIVAGENAILAMQEPIAT